LKSIFILIVALSFFYKSYSQESKNHFSISAGKIGSIYSGKMESTYLTDQSYFETPSAFSLRGWDIDFRYKFKNCQSIAISLLYQRVSVGAKYDFYSIENGNAVYEYYFLFFIPTFLDIGLEHEYPIVNKKNYQLLLMNSLSFNSDISYDYYYIATKSGVTFRWYPLKHIYIDECTYYNLNVGPTLQGYIYPAEDKTSKSNFGVFAIRPTSFHSELSIGFQF